MSNVIKNASSVTGTTQLGVIGKIYEELFTDSSGNTMVRYLRVFKAGANVAANDLVGAATSAISEMHTTGAAVKAADVFALRTQVYGVSISTVASGSYGWCVCRGVCTVASEAGPAEGSTLQVGATDGRVDTAATDDTNRSEKNIGVSMSAVSANEITAYINVL